MADQAGVSLFSSSAKPGGKKRPRAEQPAKSAATPAASATAEAEAISHATTFQETGIQDWLIRSLRTMGIRSPTGVQSACIPAALSGRHVLACAPTGSGKTAAFALPIIHKLAEDPYGIFAVVLTPARELAFQVADQFKAFGAPMGLRVCTVTGGQDLIQQSTELANKPHIVVATPGRLAHLIMSSPTPPMLSAVQFLVLDEADRLLEVSFAAHMAAILDKLPTSRQTLAFSATITSAVAEANGLSLKNPYTFDATPAPTTVGALRQFYLFMPQSVKDAHLVALLQKHGPKAVTDDSDEEEDAEEDAPARGKGRGKGVLSGATASTLAGNAQHRDEGGAGADHSQAADIPRADSAIIFVSTCKAAQEVAEMLSELGMLVVALHSVMKQSKRLASLGKFKAGVASVLVATDVASRGLDIPSVGLVVNYNMPRAAEDYIHRVGRTARAGRGGTAVSLITQYDISLLKHVEETIGRAMSELPGFDETKDVLPLLNKVGTARKMGELRLEERGFADDLAEASKRKKRARKLGAMFIAAK